jgi:hypothetical protein
VRGHDASTSLEALAALGQVPITDEAKAALAELAVAATARRG